ncbi:hypothetical protein BV898_11762 [Hypsibius exemplaris]|uniref:Ig-like domain-containing protein n=1 Tax=Hypsibius exemplaris TaxID=2072580 RepID=A0A1W0WFK0_HYPEX|nr:hypothetical protein BV898_11762 [Hypsibius exemplaris]
MPLAKVAAQPQLWLRSAAVGPGFTFPSSPATRLFWTGSVLLCVVALMADQVGVSEAKRLNVAGKQAALSMERNSGGGTRPTFDQSVPNNVTAERGHTTLLPCSIINQGSHVVSWIRKNKHLNVISVGSLIFAQDERFQLPHGGQPPMAGDWSLKIENVKPTDGGIYECQIGTNPKTTWHITLHVNAPKTMPSRRNSASRQVAPPVACCVLLLAILFPYLNSNFKALIPAPTNRA